MVYVLLIIIIIILMAIGGALMDIERKVDYIKEDIEELRKWDF